MFYTVTSLITIVVVVVDAVDECRDGRSVQVAEIEVESGLVDQISTGFTDDPNDAMQCRQLDQRRQLPLQFQKTMHWKSVRRSPGRFVWSDSGADYRTSLSVRRLQRRRLRDRSDRR